MILTTIKQVQSFVTRAIASGSALSIDTETSGTNPTTGARICGISMGFRAKNGEIETCYIPIRHKVWDPKIDIFGNTEGVDNIDPTDVMTVLRPILTSPKVLKIAHNAKFEQKMFWVDGINVTPLHCTMIMAHLVDPQSPNGLKGLLSRLFAEDLTPQHDLNTWFCVNSLGREHKEAFGYMYVPLEVVAPYSEMLDASGCLRLFEYLRQHMSTHKEVYDIEYPLISGIARMEMQGFPICLDELSKLDIEVDKDLQDSVDWMYEVAGKKFVPSPDNIAMILYKDLGIDVPIVRGPGLTDAKTLSSIKHPFVDAVLAYRTLSKFKGTYTDPLRGFTHNNRVHGSFIQIKTWKDKDDDEDNDSGGTNSGRLASKKPNMQNISKPKTYKIRGVKKEINLRKVFRIEKESLAKRVILLSDFSQIEMRLLAELSGDTALIKAFENGKDIHSATAEKVFHQTRDDMDPANYIGEDRNNLSDDEKKNYLWKKGPRFKAKAVNFGISYGMSAKTLAANHNWDIEDAIEFITLYFEEFPSVKAFNDRIMKEVKTHGFVETLYGRRRYLSEKEAYMGLNAIIQGTAADMNKIAFTRVDKLLLHTISKIINNIHDDIPIELDISEVWVPKAVKETMEDWPNLKVPVEVDQEIAWPSWGDARKMTSEEKTLFQFT